MFRRFISIAFALIFTLATGSAIGQQGPSVDVVFLFCQGNPETGDTEVCDMESSDQNANSNLIGTRCVDALALLIQQGYESFPAMALLDGGMAIDGPVETIPLGPLKFSYCPISQDSEPPPRGAFDLTRNSSNVLVIPLVFKIDVGGPVQLP